MRPVALYPLTPWFRGAMKDDDRAIVASMRAQGFDVRGYAATARGPFTATVMHEGLTHAGVGSTAAEALGRLVAKLDEAA